MLFYPCHSFWRVTTMNSFVFIPKSFPIFALLTAVRMAARTVSFFSFWFKLILVHFTPCFQRRYMAYMLQILANFSDFTPLKYFLNCPFLTQCCYGTYLVFVSVCLVFVYIVPCQIRQRPVWARHFAVGQAPHFWSSWNLPQNWRKHSPHLDISASKWDEYESVFICKKASQSSLAVKFLRNE